MNLKNFGRASKIVLLICRTLAGAITMLAPLKFRQMMMDGSPAFLRRTYHVHLLRACLGG
jgi:hypothetical protein